MVDQNKFLYFCIWISFSSCLLRRLLALSIVCFESQLKIIIALSWARAILGKANPFVSRQRQDYWVFRLFTISNAGLIPLAIWRVSWVIRITIEGPACIYLLEIANLACLWATGAKRSIKLLFLNRGIPYTVGYSWVHPCTAKWRLALVSRYPHPYVYI